MLTQQKSVYDVVYLTDCDNLYSVLSNEVCYPDLLVWREDLIERPTKALTSQVVFNTVAPYVANMTDEEANYFNTVLVQLIGIYGVYAITLTQGVMEIATVIKGEPKLLLVTVMNMIE